MRSVIFDLDGTIADTGGDLVAAANTCFREMGLGDILDPISDRVAAMQGGARAMLRVGLQRAGMDFGQEQIDEHYPAVVRAYEKELNNFTVVYDGVEQALGRLQRQGFRLGICTNKPDHLADMLLASLNLRAYFDCLVGATTLAVRKPDPAPLHEAIRQLGSSARATVLIGDSKTDRETARAADVPSVLVTFGPVGARVAELQPDALLDHYADIETVIAPFFKKSGS